MFLKPNTTGLLWKCLSVHGRGVVGSTGGGGGGFSSSSSPSSFAGSGVALKNPLKPSWNGTSLLICTRNFMTNEPESAKSTSTSTAALNALKPPKRFSNVFALFVKEKFPGLPKNLTQAEKFRIVGEEWRNLPEENKKKFSKEMTESYVVYKQKYDAYISSLSPEQIEELKQLKKDKIKQRSRAQIKRHLRELGYPKRANTGYIFHMKAQLKNAFPDENYPPVKSAENLQNVALWAKQWTNMSQEERKPYNILAEKDRKRFFAELEDWKQKLALPENEDKLHKLESLSRKAENLKKKAGAKRKQQLRSASKLAKKPKKSKTTGEKKATKTTRKAKATPKEVIEGEVIQKDDH